jgi:hypothetical protein
MFKLSGKVFGPIASLEPNSPLLAGLHGLEPLPPPAPCSSQDVRVVLNKFALSDLQRLGQAFDRGLVIRRSFSSPDGRGCLLYHLDHSIISFGKQSKFFADDRDAYLASQKLIAAWDGEKLSDIEMRSFLHDAIADREAGTTGLRPGKARSRGWVNTLSDAVDSLCVKAVGNAKAGSRFASEPARAAKATTRRSREPAPV